MSSCLKLRIILGKLKGQAPGEKNLQSKQDFICHVANVKVARSTYSMADVILFQRILLFPSNRPPKENIFYTP